PRFDGGSAAEAGTPTASAMAKREILIWMKYRAKSSGFQGRRPSFANGWGGGSMALVCAPLVERGEIGDEIADFGFPEQVPHGWHGGDGGLPARDFGHGDGALDLAVGRGGVGNVQDD